MQVIVSRLALGQGPRAWRGRVTATPAPLPDNVLAINMAAAIQTVIYGTRRDLIGAIKQLLDRGYPVANMTIRFTAAGDPSLIKKAITADLAKMGVTITPPDAAEAA